MSEPLPSWPRKYFESGGGNPFLFFVVFGEVDQSVSLSKATHRAQGVPEELEIIKYGPDVGSETVGSFRQDYLWEELKQSDPTLASAVAKQKSCFILRGAFDDPTNLDYLRDTVGLITYFWTAEAWESTTRLCFDGGLQKSGENSFSALLQQCRGIMS
jgi:hypothetical protein